MPSQGALAADRQHDRVQGQIVRSKVGLFVPDAAVGGTGLRKASVVIRCAWSFWSFWALLSRTRLNVPIKAPEKWRR